MNITDAFQTVAKWSSRFALGLSNSVPGITISRENIIYLEDEGNLLLLLIMVKTDVCAKRPWGSGHDRRLRVYQQNCLEGVARALAMGHNTDGNPM